MFKSAMSYISHCWLVAVLGNLFVPRCPAQLLGRESSTCLLQLFLFLLELRLLAAWMSTHLNRWLYSRGFHQLEMFEVIVSVESLIGTAVPPVPSPS